MEENKKVIKSEMVRLSIRMNELAEFMGLNVATTRYKVVNASWTPTEWLMLSKLFKRSVDYLMTGEMVGDLSTPQPPFTP